MLIWRRNLKINHYSVGVGPIDNGILYVAITGLGKRFLHYVTQNITINDVGHSKNRKFVGKPEKFVSFVRYF